MSSLRIKIKRKLLPFGIGFLAIICCLIPGNMEIAHASSATHAFNTSTGTLNVDYAGYLSKHDVVFNAPITNKLYGLTVANGRVGAQVWSSNGLTMQITGVDNAEQTCFSSGLVNLYTNPGMDTGYTTFQQRLNLYDGVVTVKYDSNRTVTIMGSPNSEVLGIHVDDSRSGLSSVTFDLSIWDLSTLPSTANSMFCDVPDMNTWKTVSTYNDSNGAGISRGQTDANHFGYTLAASVEGASFTTSVVNNSKVRLTITPTSSYTIWIANATRLNAPNYDSVTQAKNLLTSVKNTGYATTLANFKNWWHNFWGSSFVQYSNASGDADYLENYYYLANYIIAGGAFGNYPFQFIHGAYGAVNDDDCDKWSGGYWYWNQRDVYYSFLASNHVNVMDSFFNLYTRNYNALKSHTQSRFGIDGIWVPETMGFDGNARHTDESDYTKNIFSTGAEAAQYMYYRYKYTNDSAWLNKVYPFMREVCKFLCGKLSYNSSTGKYYMASSHAHETYWNVKNSLCDLAAVRAMFPMAIEASTILGQDSSLRSQWQNVLNNIQPFASDSNGYLPCDAPIPGTSNVENVCCELAWPYNLTGIGYADQSKANYNWNNRPFPYNQIWSPCAIQAARLGMGDDAYNGMKTMLQKFQSYPNGLTSNTNGNFEFIGVHPSVMNEALMQSYNDKIRVFPALPSDTNFISKFTLLAKGGFLVSSEKEANEIKYVGIKSLYGNMATVVNPWSAQQVQVRRASDNVIITTSSNSEFSFSTAANSVYVIERTAKFLNSYTYEQVSSIANQGEKSLSGTGCKLGLNTGSGATIVTFYQDTGFGGTAVSLNPGNYTTAQLSAAGISDNWVSSVKVPVGYTVEIYDNDNFGGTKWTFTADNSDFVAAGCNDKMSSVKISVAPGDLITNPGLETGNTTGWAVNGAGSIAVSNVQKHSGSYSLYHTGRTASWNGPLQNITSKVQNGKTYACSGWVRLDNATSGSIIMTIKKVDGSGTTYTNVATGSGGNSSWVQLSGNYTLSVSGTLTELSIYFEGPSSGVNYYLDDVSVQ